MVPVGRFAGQYAKPRSSDTETRGGTTLPSYRGDIINGPEFSAEARRPDPQRLVEAYSSSALTLNLVRALAEGGFADLHHPEYWDLDFMEHSPLAEKYHAVVDAIEDTLAILGGESARSDQAASRTKEFLRLPSSPFKASLHPRKPTLHVGSERSC